MTPATEIQSGTRIRFTDGPLGTYLPMTRTPADPVVAKGSGGVYRSPDPLTGEDWHLALIWLDGEMFHVPVHVSQFEVLS